MSLANNTPSHDTVIEELQRFDFGNALYSKQNEMLYTNLASSYRSSELCIKHLILTAEALERKEHWATQMVDAFGKFPSGILDGYIKWTGSFDECNRVRAVVYRENCTEHVFEGQYCYISFPLSKFSDASVSITEGLCIPNSCSQGELSEVLEEILSVIQAENITITAKARCVPKTLELDTKAMVAITILSVLGAFVILGTVYDVIFIPIICNQRSLTTFSINRINENGNLDENVPLINKQKENLDSFRPKMIENVLLAFSIYTNGKKMLSTEQSSGNLSCLHGVRFLSISWVILGHSFVYMLSSTGNVLSYTSELFRRFTFQVIENGPISVDTFFALSGLLVSYVTLKELRKKQGKINWFKFYFHRFWRLTPPYMLVLMVDVCLFRYFGNGPFWPTSGVEHDGCKNSWWKNLLYINNFFSINEMCMPWSWYLSNDMQFFVISPIFTVLLFKYKFVGIVICCLFIVASIITTGFISYQNDFSNSMLEDIVPSVKYIDIYYTKPYCRIGPYIVGILTGYILFKTKCQVRMNKYLNIFCWMLAAALALTVVYGPYDPDRTHHLCTITNAVYNATSRTAWGLCVSWVIFACVTGNGGFVNTILSWSPFVPLGRLTYCTYLVHVLVLNMYTGYLRTLVVSSDLTMIFLFFGLLVASHMVAFVASIMFESPMMGLEKVLFRRKKTSN